MKKIKTSDRPFYQMQDRAAERIVHFLMALQNRFVRFMSSKINRLSTKTKQGWLFIFCLVFAGFSIHVFTGAFNNHAKAVKAINPGQLSLPKYWDDKMEGMNPVVGDNDIDRIGRFEKYMDSLSKSAQGRIVYDSMMKARPGLSDSIKIIKQIYSQTK